MHPDRRILLNASSVALLLPVIAAAQDSLPGWRAEQLPMATEVVYAVRWHGGLRYDDAAECGLSRVLAECRLRRARARVPAVRASAAVVTDCAAIVYCQVPAAEAVQGQRFVAALLDDRMPLADDDLAEVIARVALAADDSAWLYPGPALLSRARAAALASGGHAIHGDAAAILALTPARVRAALVSPAFAGGLVLGKAPDDAFAGLPQLAPQPALPRRSPLPREAAAGFVEWQQNRLDAPFVAVGFCLPPAVDRVALALGLEVVRQRAASALPARPEELLPRLQRLTWSWLHDDPVVVLALRGSNWGPAAAPMAQLFDFLADVQQRPATAAELVAAQQQLRLELDPLPRDPQLLARQAAGAALSQWAVTLLQAAAVGLDPSPVLAGDAVAMGPAVQAAVAAVLQPAAAVRLAMLPSQQPPPPGTPRLR